MNALLMFIFLLFQNLDQVSFPSSQRRGGCAIKECREATETAQTGWSDRESVSAEPTTPALSLRLRPIGLALRGATPPLQGGEFVNVLSRRETREPIAFQVRHEHTIGSCEGTLTFTGDAVWYETMEKNHSRKWSYPDVKYFEIVSNFEFVIHSYENQGVEQFGRDRDFDFRVLTGAITDALYEMLVEKSPRAVVTHVVFHGTEVVQELPVRHRHRIGGCQGTLTIATDKVIYRTDQKEDSRIWRLQDIESFASSDPFSLPLSTAFETFTLDLKLPLEQTAYDLLWKAVYAPKIQTYRR